MEVLEKEIIKEKTLRNLEEIVKNTDKYYRLPSSF